MSDVGTVFDIGLNDDHFVIVWTDEPQLLAQRFAYDGTPLGAQITVDSNNAINPPAVVVEADGSFTVLWTPSSGQALHARSYRADDTPVSTAVVLDTPTNVGLNGYDVEVTSTDRLIAGYIEVSGGVGWLSQNMKFDDDGGNVVVDTLFTDSSSLRSRLAGDAEVGFVQFGERLVNMLSVVDYSARRLDGAGQPTGVRFPIPAINAERHAFCRPDLAVAPDGSFVAVWQRRIDPGQFELAVIARPMGGDDLPMGNEHRLNDHLAGQGLVCPSIARGRDGRYLVVWGSETAPPGGNDDSGSSISGRFLGADGVPSSDSFQVNDVIEFGQGVPTVRADPSGNRFLVVYYQRGGSHFQLQARVYAATTFLDGFEAGDTSAWDVTVP